MTVERKVAPGHVKVRVELTKEEVDKVTFGMLLIFEMLKILPTAIFALKDRVMVKVVLFGTVLTTQRKLPTWKDETRLVIIYRTSPTARLDNKDAPGQLKVKGAVVLKEQLDGVMVGTVVTSPLLKTKALRNIDVVWQEATEDVSMRFVRGWLNLAAV